MLEYHGRGLEKASTKLVVLNSKSNKSAVPCVLRTSSFVCDEALIFAHVVIACELPNSQLN